MREELEKLGANVTEHPDGLTVYPATITGGTVESHDDHRVAMALAIVALRATDPVTIERADAAAVTYPGFFDAFTALGGRITRGESA
jgi:3-phosphoshikimate 1-carboxyvinyltransferase